MVQFAFLWKENNKAGKDLIMQYNNIYIFGGVASLLL